MTPSTHSEFLDCNHTELYQVCHRLGHNIAPGTPKEQMIAYLMGEAEVIPQEHVVNSWRHGLMGFLLDQWQTVRSQLTCPAKSGDARACFGCIDTQVIACLVSNPENEDLIQLKRKNES